MLSLPDSVKVYLASKPTDMRKSIDGLLALARTTVAADPFAGHLFVFVGRRRDRVKVLFWDRGGFVVFYKRLERLRFQVRLPEAGAPYAELEATELAMLLRGIDYARVRRPDVWTPGRKGAATGFERNPLDGRSPL